MSKSLNQKKKVKSIGSLANKAYSAEPEQQAFNEALHYFHQAQYAGAIHLFKRITDQNPINIDALYLLAISLMKSGDSQAAIGYFIRAIQLNPNNSQMLNNCGVCYKLCGKLDDAIASYNKALSIDPSYAEAYNNRGNALQQIKKFDEAIASYNKALSIDPSYAEAYNNRGNALQQIKKFDEAIESYGNALKLNPGYVRALNNRGIAFKELGLFNLAIESYEQALKLEPNYAEAHNNLGIALKGRGLFDAALLSLNKAVELNPRYVDAFINRGIVLKELGHFGMALENLNRAIELNPNQPESYNNKGNILLLLGNFVEASQVYEKAIQIDPAYIDAHINYAISMKELKKYDVAIESFQRAFDLNPSYDFILGSIHHLKMLMSSWGDYEKLTTMLLKGIEEGRAVTYPFSLLSISDSLDLHKKVSEIYFERVSPRIYRLGPIAPRERGGKIRVGYFSADFYLHATAFLMAEYFESCNKDKFEIIAFSLGPKRVDAMRTRLMNSFDQFIDVNNYSDEKVAQLSRDMGIDIAVDLKGYTKESRVGIFAHRAAPIQISYIGYPGTMGTKCIDYMVADPITVPPISQSFYSEKIIYLPSSYQVNDSKRLISDRRFTREELGLPVSGFVYACFNNSYKILPATFRVWMSILGAVEESVLWLLDDNQWAVENLRREAKLLGIDPSRLIFAPRMSLEDHLARHIHANLFLDTWPYNAHTTASDALWACLPVLTYAGESFPSRVGASLLNSLGLNRLITTSVDAYKALAIDLAKNPIELNEIRKELERSRSSSPLFDGRLFCRHLESGFMQAMDRYYLGLDPDHIFINDSLH
ncbi:tetratricopeptide repeat protein [Polynucleobacter sp. MWH-UH2A]|uniref:tetratricopeptide repeat protein n=1 Tax=Polynucleobacter sp. MWH-UH2A TaxID=1855617 RepID=UPI001BFE9933|nr:tetratricopeptide repeat protein [Polynucleobacter sp. MWH-UH2A]